MTDQYAAPQPEAAKVDLNRTLEHVFGGDAAGLAKTLALFAELAPEQLAQAASAVQGQDGVTVAARCHSLANSAAMLLAEPLRRRALSIEAAARQGDWNAVRTALPELQTSLQAVLRAVKEYRQRHTV